MRRNQQICRVLRIQKLIVNSFTGLTVAEIKAHLANQGVNASKRTIYRDLDAIDQSGTPLISCPSEETREGARWKVFSADKDNFPQ